MPSFVVLMVSKEIIQGIILPVILFQSFGIGYLALHPNGQVRVYSDDPRPVIRVKPDANSGFRRYGFVDAVLGLDPVSKLGLTATDYKVI